MKLGIENHKQIKKNLKGKNVSVICNISSVDASYNHVVDILIGLGINVKSIMGPQHGFIMDKQDNMIESSNVIHPEYEVPVFSLYGETREPTEVMLKDIDVVAFDLQDVGARYYTFIYTMANAMKACARYGKRFLVFDRPNPLNGVTIEGGIVHKGFESFVGQYPISHRHGMTVAELALMFNTFFEINCELEIIKLEGWKRKNYWDVDSTHQWIIPSPNMPTFDTALVYTGQCLLEATNISEGRGTTRPFEIFGAPFISHKEFINYEIIKSLEGVFFRQLFFQPTFNKFAGKQCSGFQLHITNRDDFDSLKTTLAIIFVLNRLYPNEFAYKSPPYEYEYHKMPIDILLGSAEPRLALNNGADFEEFCTLVDAGKKEFIENRKEFLLY